ncbi:hypothetical protein BD779DRAFT_1672029 [Infundibulicybe gibba]|nr:hypothetical protein BD779DRAFT_1672029 [Infundibulicybe gibba]
MVTLPCSNSVSPTTGAPKSPSTITFAGSPIFYTHHVHLTSYHQCLHANAHTLSTHTTSSAAAAATTALPWTPSPTWMTPFTASGAPPASPFAAAAAALLACWVAAGAPAPGSVPTVVAPAVYFNMCLGRVDQYETFLHERIRHSTSTAVAATDPKRDVCWRSITGAPVMQAQPPSAPLPRSQSSIL